MRASEHPNHAAIRARFPGVKLDGGGLTVAQGRLCFHQERLLFGRPNMAEAYRARCAALNLPVTIGGMHDWQVRLALYALEVTAQRFPVIGRSPYTQWQDVSAEAPTNGND